MPIDHVLPNDLDDLYGSGAEDADTAAITIARLQAENQEMRQLLERWVVNFKVNHGHLYGALSGPIQVCQVCDSTSAPSERVLNHLSWCPLPRSQEMVEEGDG